MGHKSGRIVAGGMGCFLNPPTHPEHYFHVETELRRKPENRSGMCLSSASTSTWLDLIVKNQAKRKLAEWVPLPLNHPDVQDWIHRVLGYFRNCYCNHDFAEPECWYASNLVIKTRGPNFRCDHAGVHHIRKYYPDYEPTLDNWHNAYWGTKNDH